MSRLLDLVRGSGRDPSRATYALRGVVALAVVVALVGVLLAVGRGAFSDRMSVVARVDDAGGSLVTGADVKYDGVVVGRVSSLDPGADGGVDLALALDPSTADGVPRNVVARVLPASVFGTSYLDLRTEGPPRGQLEESQRIAQDSSAETLEIQRLLDGLDGVVDALGPAELATTLEGLAGALDGNGEQLGETIEDLHSFLRKLNPEMPLVRRNLQLLATNLEAFERYAPGLLDATDDVLVTAATLAGREDEFRALVRSGSSAFDRTESVLRANQDALAAMLMRTAVLVDVLHDGRTPLVQGLLETGRLARGFSDALPRGQYLRIDGELITGESEEYGRDGCPSYGSHQGRGC